MPVTRDVIYDLLPAYFSGDLSADSRALIQEFFTTDPEFGRMAERFRTLHDDHLVDDEQRESDAAMERATFDQMKSRLRRRQAVAVWGMGAFVACAMAIPAMVDGGVRYPGVIVGAVFAVMAVITWFWSRRPAGRSAVSRTWEDGLPNSRLQRTSRRTRKHA